MFTLGQGLEVRRPVEVEVGVPGGCGVGVRRGLWQKEGWGLGLVNVAVSEFQPNPRD